MIVQLKDAADTVDRFEELLATNGISIPRNPATGANMLPIWLILEQIRKGTNGALDEMRNEYTAAIAVHDLAAKVLAVKDNAQFKKLLPHLEMLSSGALHLFEDPPVQSDAYNKLIEAYWASLLMAAGVTLEVDHPKHALGDNPDVIALDDVGQARAYAFKTVRSPHTQNLLDHLTKGVAQIERSQAREGVVALHLTPRILKETQLWPEAGKAFADWRKPAALALEELTAMVVEILKDNGQPAIDAIFAGKKAASSVLCIAMFPTVAINPETGNAAVMPIKVAQLVAISDTSPDLPPKKWTGLCRSALGLGWADVAQG